MERSTWSLCSGKQRGLVVSKPKMTSALFPTWNVTATLKRAGQLCADIPEEQMWPLILPPVCFATGCFSLFFHVMGHDDDPSLQGALRSFGQRCKGLPWLLA